MITSDWHQHSHHSVDCRQTGRSLERLATEMAALRVEQFGVTDHVHTPQNLPDLAASRTAFSARPWAPGFRFGVELSVVSRWELEELEAGRGGEAPYGLRSGGPEAAAPALALEAQHLVEYGIEYVVGGTHWPLYVPLEPEAVIRDYHRQNLFLATHPLVTIVAHPWWWMGGWQDADGMYRGDPWLDDFGKVPPSMHDEFVAAVLGHGKVVEANLGACLCNATYPERFRRQYAEILAEWQERGVPLAIGSDDHGGGLAPLGRLYQAGEALLSAAGVRLADLWQLPPRQVSSAG